MAKQEEKQTFYFTGVVTWIEKHPGGVIELSLSYKGRPQHSWIAAKLFGESKQLVSGKTLEVVDPFAKPDNLVWTSCPTIKKGDWITIETKSEPKESRVIDKKKRVRKTDDGRIIKKLTYNLNYTTELRPLKPK